MAEEKKPAGKLALLAFAPWIVYIVFAGAKRWDAAAVGGAIVCLVYLAILNRRSTIKLMDWTTLAYFVTAAFIIVGLRSSAFPVYQVIVIWSFFAAAAWTSIAVGKPFTLAYAREQQPFPEIWEFPVFKRTNLILTAFWGGVFSVNVGFAVLSVIIGGDFGKLVPGFLIPTALLVFAFVFSARFPARYVARFNERAAAASGGPIAE
jgi:hypothetical protein